MRRLLALAALLPLPAIAAPGDRIRWAVVDADGTCPDVRAIELSVAAADSAEGRARHWLQLEVRSEQATIVRVAILADVAAAPFERSAVRRYQLFPREGPSIEYVHADGRAALPVVGLWRVVVPRGEGEDLLFREGTLLGRRLVEAERGGGAAAWSRATDRRLVLDEEVLVATSRAFRDDGTGRDGRDWRWREFDADAYRAMIGAGFNLFGVPLGYLPFVRDEPVFFVLESGFREHPDLAWRSNYRGAVHFMDEPAVHAMRDGTLEGVREPAEVADRIGAAVAVRREGSGKYGRGFLAARLAAERCAFGAPFFGKFPVWEAAASAIPVEMEAGARGAVWEARLRPSWFARRVHAVLGVRFPDDARACIAHHLAILRGAGRRFDRPWGVSVYGQMEPAAADLLFPLAYDAGATYFWLWTSDGDHHVPFARQLELVRALRARQRERPRPEGSAARSAAARVAIVVPRGYALDEVALPLGAEGGAPGMWEAPDLELGQRNAAGAAHRDVLAAAMRESADLLARDVDFDILFLRDDEEADGYDEVRRVGADAVVRARPDGR